MHRHVAMVTECGRDGESCGKTPSEGVDQYVDRFPGVLFEDVVYEISVEVLASDISFQVQVVVGRHFVESEALVILCLHCKFI